MTAAQERIAAVVRLEFLTQRREPLTTLYVIVLGCLATAFAAAGPVDLVRNRGAVPRDAAWSIWLAATALTAFGQIITTMVAATVVLRDQADRVQEMLVATRLTRREYLAGKLIAALAILGMIYTAIPIGLVVGALLAGGEIMPGLRASIPPFFVLVLPTMLAVGALQFTAGVRCGRLSVIVGLGVLLIWLWSACVDAAASPGMGGFASLLDPFGSAPVLHATAAWTDAERALRPMPVTSAMLANRALWLMLGGSAALWSLRSAPRVMRSRVASDATEPDAEAPTGQLAQVVASALPAWRSCFAIATYVSRWMLRDTGWRVLALLGVVNVTVHAYLDAGSGAVSAVAVASLQRHARLFLILLATIYAGELVWRERDDRSAPLFDALPARDGPLVVGRILGVFVAQATLVAVLTCGAMVGVMVGARTHLDVAPVLTAAARTVLLPFALWMLLALAVHSVLQQKVAAHLLCIGAWVAAVLASRVAALPTDGDRFGPGGVLCAVLAVVVSWLSWVRGEPGSSAVRFRTARRRAGMRWRADTRLRNEWRGGK